MRSEILDHAIVVEQRVVHVEQEYHIGFGRHADARPGLGLGQQPPGAMSAAACFGPQLWRRQG